MYYMWARLTHAASAFAIKMGTSASNEEVFPAKSTKLSSWKRERRFQRRYYYNSAAFIQAN